MVTANLVKKLIAFRIS